ncbi:Head completion/stabilization protein L [Escherichia coli]|nr:Head completion/stabilization protein L [Escherichia coli]
MSMVARTEPGPAEDDITDTDDGDTRIQQVHSGRILCCASCVWRYDCRARVTTSRLLHTATGAVAHVTRELEAWQQEQRLAIRRWPMFRHP